MSHEHFPDKDNRDVFISSLNLTEIDAQCPLHGVHINYGEAKKSYDLPHHCYSKGKGKGKGTYSSLWIDP